MSETRLRRSIQGVGSAAVAVLLLQASAPPAAAQQRSVGAAPAATFAKDIAPILQKSCQECHRPGSIGPMSLRTYDEVRPWVRAIKQRVVAREMPPYRYDHIGIQELKGDLRLSETEIETIARWADSGAPLGNVADLPAPVQFPDGSKWAWEDHLGPPDLVVPTKPYTLPAQGQDRWWRPIVPVGTTVDRWQDLKSYSLLMKGGELEIPPHGTAMTQGFHSFKTPVRIDSFQPHGHARLVQMTAEIFYPDTGKLEMISSVSNWTNQWHTSHVYEDDYAPLLSKGAVLVLTGYYDNSAKNKGNPDPDQWVGGGSRTADEMSHAWITVTHLDDEGYKQLAAERESRAKAKKANTDQGQ